MADSLEDFLAHYGVLGMKWGVRKDRAGNKRPTKDVKREEKRRSRKAKNDASKSNDRSNKSSLSEMSDEDLRKVINRLQMERQLSQLTASDKAPPSRVKTMLKDVAYDATKGAATEVGKAILAQALKTEFNKRVSTGYQIGGKKK